MDKGQKEENLVEVENRVIAHANTTFEPKFFCCCCNCDFLNRHSGSIPIILEELNSTQKVLVLDLDETLVHCSFHPPDYYDFSIQITIDEGTYDVFIQKRPFVDQFLAEVLRYFYVVIFTASLPQYANPIIDYLCPTLPEPQRLFRESCTFYEGLFVKDLTIFNTPLEKVIIVDNNPCSFLLHPSNAVLSSTWEGDKNDSELIDYILPILQQCIHTEDVRPILAAQKKEI